MILLFLLIFCALGFAVIKQVRHPFIAELNYKDYVSIITSLASLFVALVFILEYCHIQKSEKHVTQLPFADAKRDYRYDLETRLAKDPDLYPLYSELHSNHPELREAVSTKNHRRIKEVQVVSLILHEIENMIIHQGGLAMTRTDQQIRVWKRFFKSPTVRYDYQFLKDNYNSETNRFIQQTLW
jgi:hypothetical protein